MTELAEVTDAVEEDWTELRELIWIWLLVPDTAAGRVKLLVEDGTSTAGTVFTRCFSTPYESSKFPSLFQWNQSIGIC